MLRLHGHWPCNHDHWSSFTFTFSEILIPSTWPILLDLHTLQTASGKCCLIFLKDLHRKTSSHLPLRKLGKKWKTTQIIPSRYVESSAQWYMANYFPDETMTFVEVFLLFINLNSLLIKKHCWPGRSDPWKPTVGSVAQFCQWSTWRPKRRIALKENYEMLIMLIPAWCSDNDI